jgi:SAM-dependent methyltransferase
MLAAAGRGLLSSLCSSLPPGSPDMPDAASIEPWKTANPYPVPYHWCLSAFYNRKYEQPHRLIGAHLRPTDHAVDIGCGDGRRAALLLPFVRRVCGVDHQERPLRFARLLVDSDRLELVRHDVAGGLPFRSETVDVVTAFEFIEHVPLSAARLVLADAHRALRPGGRLILTTPNRRSLHNRVWGHRLNPKHCYEVSLPELRELVESTGFEVLALTGVYLPIPLPGIEHYAGVIPFRGLFSLLIRAGGYLPALSDTLVVVGRKRAVEGRAA